MAINLKNQILATPIEQMLQGVTCLMAYKDSIQNRASYEAEFVTAACEILNSHLGRQDYSVVMEYPYRDIIGGDSKQEADLVIIKKSDNKKRKGKVICVMEFKMSTDYNGNVYKDIFKLQVIRNKKIDRLSILLFLKPKKSLRSRFVTDSFNAKKGIVSISRSNSNQCANVYVRRVTKVFRSLNSKRDPYMAVCIAV